MSITTIIFDLNKVLVTYEKNDLDKEYREHLNISQKEFWSVGTKIFKKTDMQTCSIDQFFLTILDELNIPQTKLAIAKKLHEQGFSLVEGMQEILDSLQNYKLILLAGDGKEALHFKVRNFHLDKYFSSMYATYAEGKDKKDPTIYTDLLQRENLKPEECLFIDDIKAHTDIAKRLKINTILFKDATQLKKELKKIL